MSFRFNGDVVCFVNKNKRRDIPCFTASLNFILEAQFILFNVFVKLNEQGPNLFGLCHSGKMTLEPSFGKGCFLMFFRYPRNINLAK